MKIPARIAVPITLALLCAGLLMALLWWQITESTAMLQSTNRLAGLRTTIVQETGIVDDSFIDPRDQALLNLRQGDLFALRGQWKEAQEMYEKAVDADGGLPALRKLAQAQLQRRDISGIRSTIRKLRSAGARPEDLVLLESIVELRAGELVKARSILDASADSPQKNYGLALLGIVEGDHSKTKERLTDVMNGWEPVLRSNARTLMGAYDEFALFPEGSNLHLITLIARALAQVQECELALPLLVQVTNVQSDYRDAWIVQGFCELTTERHQQALTSLENAYNLDPQKPEIQYFLGRTHAALEQHQNAITFLEYSLVNGFQPEAEIRRIIAEEALKNDDPELALSQYDALTQSENATLETFEGFIAASLALGQNEEAYLKAAEAQTRWSQDAKAYELLGEAARATNRIDEARQAFEKALIINPNLDHIEDALRNLDTISVDKEE